MRIGGGNYFASDYFALPYYAGTGNSPCSGRLVVVIRSKSNAAKYNAMAKKASIIDVLSQRTPVDPNPGRLATISRSKSNAVKYATMARNASAIDALSQRTPVDPNPGTYVETTVSSNKKDQLMNKLAKLEARRAAIAIREPVGCDT